MQVDAANDQPAAAVGGLGELADAGLEGALLEGAFGLADEAVDVDYQAPCAWSRTRRPGALDRLARHQIELADVAEAEGAQEGAECRGRHRPVAEQGLGGAGAQHVCVLDRVSASRDCVDQGEHLAPGAGGARLLTEADRLIDQGLDPEPDAQGGTKTNPALAISRSSSNSTPTESRRTDPAKTFTM